MRICLSLIFAALLIFAAPHIAHANDYTCDLSGNPYGNFRGCHSDLNPQGSTSYVVSGNSDEHNITCSGTNNCSARAGGLSVAPICAWGNCYWVDSNAVNAYFVPFRTANEWTAFITAARSGRVSGVSVTPAAMPATQNGQPSAEIAPPYEGCAGQQTPTPNVYGRAGYSSWSASPVGPVFNCHQSSRGEAPCYVQSSIVWNAENSSRQFSCSWTPHISYGPDLSFSVAAVNTSPSSSVTITAGSNIRLNWRASSATKCQASGGWSGAKATTGSETLSVVNSNSYTLTCTAPCGLTTTSTIHVTVTSPPMAACGANANQTIASAPTQLCTYGSTPGAVTATDTGWNWTCANGNSQHYCSATMYQQPVNAMCGEANNTTLSAEPTADLCATGMADTVTGTGPWFWNCVGANGGASASCSAQPEPLPPIAGSCGGANGVPAATAPTANLCATGTASATAGAGPWNWYCYGANGGATVSCSAPLQPALVTGICGDANGTTVVTAPTTNLCSAGTTSSVSGTGPWNWTCAGAYGGADASCSANLQPPVNGACGSANSTSVTAAPTTNLCSIGTPSAVSGNGPWSWTCTGSYGGTTASCAAQLQQTPVNGQCGSANGTNGTSAPTANLCSVGAASPISGTGPWNWTCAGAYGGTSASCAAQSGAPVNGQCANLSILQFLEITQVQPSSGICASGTAVNITANGFNSGSWTCQGSNGGTSISCRTPPRTSPLVLDISGAGLQLLNLQQSHAHFDMLNDGTRVHTAWIGPKNAFLVLDRNGDGTVDDRLEMFGNMRGAANGFQDLAAYDSNGDGVIDAKDPIYGKLKLWVDRNGDGVSQKTDLYSLSQLGIASISVQSESMSDQFINGQMISNRATFTLANGKQGYIYDVWFETE